MKALVIYDSQYGNTAQIAHAIADGLKSAAKDAIEVDLRTDRRCPAGAVGGSGCARRRLAHPAV